jgi:hypothetical protein
VRAKAILAALVRVLVSRPVRPYEVAIGIAVFKAVEKAAGFKVGF